MFSSHWQKECEERNSPMRLAVISDIHGECLALDQVLQDIRRQGIEQMVCLGDALQGGSQPAETLARLRELNCPVVMGNADAWLITGQQTSAGEEISQKQREVRAWSLAQLSESDIAFVQQFPSTIEIPLEAGKTLLCFHGSPRSFDEIILPETPADVVRQFLGGYDATLLTGGHTHTQQMRRLGNSWYFNPGSVSLPYNWGPITRSSPLKERLWASPFVTFPLMSTNWHALFAPAADHMPKRPSPSIYRSIERYISLRHPCIYSVQEEGSRA
jgi:putative phosphoesterase